MHIELDPLLLEEAVFLAMRCQEQTGDQALYRQYRSRVDALYDLPGDRDVKDIAFRDVHAEFFGRLGLEQMLRSRLDEFPPLPQELDRIAFLKAASRKQEGGELFVRHDEKIDHRHQTAVVRLRAEVFLEPDRLSMLLRRELSHIGDMVDPAFGYRPDLGETGDSVAQHNLIRDRYRVLWDLYVDARLVNTNRAPVAVLKKQEKLLNKVFEGVAERDTGAVFQTVCRAELLTHADLLELAKAVPAATAAFSSDASLGEACSVPSVNE